MTQSEQENGSASAAAGRIQYGGHDRFTLELEVGIGDLNPPLHLAFVASIGLYMFVQMLSNPHYLQHLAAQKLLDNEEFLAYLDYLQYFRQPNYVRFLQYPGPTLRALDLLKEEQFRKDILIPEVVERMTQEGFEAATSGY